MKKITRLLIVAALCAALCIGVMLVSASAAEIVDSGKCGTNLTWSLDSDGLLTIDGEGEMWDYSFADYDSSIGDFRTSAPWGKYVTSIKSVLVGDSVESIGGKAFYNCSSLASITIPDSVTSIGCEAFYNTAYCKNKTNWENGVLYIGKHLIKSESLSIKDGTKTIAGGVFYARDDLKNITIPDSVTSIGDRAFALCRNLTSITIPDGITNIGGEAFSYCGLTSITIPESVTSIGARAFYDCSSLASVTISNGATSGITKIGLEAFSCCSSLASVTIGNSVESIGVRAFYNCSSLASVTIPDSVASIGGEAFYNCSSLASITIPDSVTSIGGEVFYNCSSLVSITIPDGVTRIVSNIFKSCYKLKSITIPNSVTKIENNAFCESIRDLFYSGTADEWKDIEKEYEWNNGFYGRIHFNVADVATHGTFTKTIEATCSEGGYDIYSCNCNSSYYYINYTEKLGHDYKDGVCMRCYMIEPPSGWIADPEYATPIENGTELKISKKICGKASYVLRAGNGSVIEIDNQKYENGYCTATIRALKEGVSTVYIENVLTGENTGETTYIVVSHIHKYTSYVFNNDAKIGIDGTETATCGCGETHTRIKVGSALVLTEVFTDVKANAYYADAVIWAVNNKITSGVGKNQFAPKNNCTRGEVVTFLWRANGCPEPTTTENPFSDIKPNDFYYKAVLWAVEKNVTSGTGGGKFSPKATCTRSQVATFIWRAEGKPEPTATENPFSDIKPKDYYYKAVLWAVEKGITGGTGNGKFSPNTISTREQIVTFLYRDLGKKPE